MNGGLLGTPHNPLKVNNNPGIFTADHEHAISAALLKMALRDSYIGRMKIFKFKLKLNVLGV